MRSSSYSAAVPATLPLKAAPAWWEEWRLDTAVILTIAARFVVIAAGVVTSIMTARFLLPAGRGEYFLALTTAQMLSQFCNLGLASSNTYFVAKDRTLFSSLLSNTAWISFLGVPAAATVVLGLASFSGTPLVPSGYAWFVIALAPLIMFNLLGANLFVGLEQVGRFNVVQIAGAAVLLPLMILAGLLGAGPHGFLTASITGWAIVAALVWWMLAHQSRGGFAFRRDVFVTSFKYSMRAYLATMAGFMVLRMNVFTLHAVVGPEQVGYYSVASQIADTLSALPQSIALVLFPKLVASEADRFKTTVQNAVRTTGLMVLVCGGMWLIADPAIRFAFGPGFAPATPILRAMLPGVLLLGVMAIVSQYLAASGFPISVVVSWLLAMGMAAGLGRVLIAKYGAVGAGLTLSITYAALLVVLAFLCWRMAATRSDSLPTE